MRSRYFAALSLVVLAVFALPTAFAQESRLPPSNDNSGSATSIALNGKYKVEDIQLATTELGEADCGIIADNGWRSVWFIFQAPFDATISISTIGSKIFASEFNSSTSVGLSLYANDPLNQLDCTMSLGGVPAQFTDVSINQGTWYFIRVTSLIATPLPGSYYMLRTSVDSVSGFISLGMQNNSFESGLAPWVAKNALNGDQVVCGTGDAFSGPCAYKFVGGASEASSIKQTFAWPTAQFYGLRDQLVLGQGYIRRTGTGIKASISLKVSYTDGTPASIVKLPVSTAGNYAQINIQLELASRSVANVTFKVKHKSTDGTVVVDQLDVVYLAGVVRNAGSSPLSVPPPAGE